MGRMMLMCRAESTRLHYFPPFRIFRYLTFRTAFASLTALFTAYLGGRLAATREQFIDYCVEMLLSRAATH